MPQQKLKQYLNISRATADLDISEEELDALHTLGAYYGWPINVDWNKRWFYVKGLNKQGSFEMLINDKIYHVYPQ